MASILDDKLLTIIIPTYNRCNEIKQNLGLSIPQVMEYPDKVRIYISDNASTDGTSEMVKPYLKRYPENVFYYRQEKNITASPNFNHAVHAVNSEYIFILGDDDFLFPNFIQVVLKLIDNNPDVGLFHFNYLLGKKNLSCCRLYHSSINIKCTFQKYENGKLFIPIFFDTPSFVSSNLFKRSMWIEGAKFIKEDCPGYVWYSILLYGCINYPCAYYSLPLIIQGWPQVSSYSKNWPLYYVCGLGNLFKHLDEQIPGLYQKWIVHSQREDYRNLFLALSSSTYSRKYYKENSLKIRLHLKRKIFSFYFTLCLLPIPKIFTGKIFPLLVKILTIKKIV